MKKILLLCVLFVFALSMSPVNVSGVEPDDNIVVSSKKVVITSVMCPCGCGQKAIVCMCPDAQKALEDAGFTDQDISDYYSDKQKAEKSGKDFSGSAL